MGNLKLNESIFPTPLDPLPPTTLIATGVPRNGNAETVKCFTPSLTEFIKKVLQK